MEEKLLLPIYKNWHAFIREERSQGHFEYELLSDAIITGENTTDFGPYKLINPVNRNSKVRAVLVLRIDNRLPFHDFSAMNIMKKTDTGCYHGGDLPDEVAALISLALGVRMRAGVKVREFASSGDNFGRPVGWEMPIMPSIVPEYGRYKLLSPLQEASITLLEPLKHSVSFQKIKWLQ